MQEGSGDENSVMGVKSDNIAGDNQRVGKGKSSIREFISFPRIVLQK